MVMSPKPLQVRKLCLSKVTALLIRMDPDGGIGRPGCHPKKEQARLNLSLLVHAQFGKLSSHDEKKATHVFIDSFDDAEKQKLDRTEP